MQKRVNTQMAPLQQCKGSCSKTGENVYQGCYMIEHLFDFFALFKSLGAIFSFALRPLFFITGESTGGKENSSRSVTSTIFTKLFGLMDGISATASLLSLPYPFDGVRSNV